MVRNDTLIKFDRDCDHEVQSQKLIQEVPQEKISEVKNLNKRVTKILAKQVP